MGVTAIFKLFYKKIEMHYSKNRIRLEVKRFCVIQTNKPISDLIDDLNYY